MILSEAERQTLLITNAAYARQLDQRQAAWEASAPQRAALAAQQEHIQAEADRLAQERERIDMQLRDCRARWAALQRELEALA